MARELAFRVVYQEGVTGDGFRATWAAVGEGGSWSDDQRALVADVVGLLETRAAEVDAVLREACTHWPLERLAATDRAVLRIAVAELMARAGLAGAGGAGRGHRDRAALRLGRVGRLRQRGARPGGAAAAPGRAVMLRAVLSDVHSNLEALEAVLADVERSGAAELLCLGDFVGYGASPNECPRRGCGRCSAAAVLGNHDVAACGRGRLGDFTSNAAQAARWTGTVLSPENRAWLESLPYERRHGGALLVHASPAEPRGLALRALGRGGARRVRRLRGRPVPDRALALPGRVPPRRARAATSSTPARPRSRSSPGPATW